jgi:hypothetical protein
MSFVLFYPNPFQNTTLYFRNITGNVRRQRTKVKETAIDPLSLLGEGISFYLWGVAKTI